MERRVSRTLLACAFRWISCSSSRTGGTKDLGWKIVRLGTRIQIGEGDFSNLGRCKQRNTTIAKYKNTKVAMI